MQIIQLRTTKRSTKINFIREAITNKQITLLHVRSEDNKADMGTKSLGNYQHTKLTDQTLTGEFEEDYVEEE